MINLVHKLKPFSCRKIAESGVAIATASRAKKGKNVTMANYLKIVKWLGKEEKAPRNVYDLTVNEFQELVMTAVQEGLEQAKPDLPAPKAHDIENMTQEKREQALRAEGIEPEELYKRLDRLLRTHGINAKCFESVKKRSQSSFLL